MRRAGLFITLFLLSGLPEARATMIDILSEGTLFDPTEFNSVGANVVITPVSAWATAPPAAWVSFADTGLGGSPPANGTVVTFTQPFSLPGPINTGSVTVWADDTAAVFLDGGLVFAANFPTDGVCAAGPIGCEPGEGGVISLDGLAAGPHALTFEVFQLHGDGYGLLYKGAVNSVPEPSTLLLLGSALAWAMVRTRKTLTR